MPFKKKKKKKKKAREKETDRKFLTFCLCCVFYLQFSSRAIINFYNM